MKSYMSKATRKQRDASNLLLQVNCLLVPLFIHPRTLTFSCVDAKLTHHGKQDCQPTPSTLSPPSFYAPLPSSSSLPFVSCCFWHSGGGSSSTAQQARPVPVPPGGSELQVRSGHLVSALCVGVSVC